MGTDKTNETKDNQVNDESDVGCDRLANEAAAEVHNYVESETTPPALPNGKKKKKRSVGCLVVVGMLFVLGAYLWSLMEPFTILARYAAEAVPVIGNLRTRVELYRTEKGRLPGLRANADGTSGSTSRLAEGLSGVQTFYGMDTGAFTADFGKVVAVTNENQVFREVAVTREDVTGKNIKPKHVQYRVDACQGDRYLYVLGTFGDGKGLKAGTGCAVLEFCDSASQSKGLMTWERYKPVKGANKQIVLINAEEARKYFKCETPEQAWTMNLCWVGDTEALMSGDKARVEKALEELRKAGWR